MGTSVLHIKTEMECKVFLFDEEKGIAYPDKYFNLEVRKGEQDLLFISTENEDMQCSLQYQVEEYDCDYRIRLEKSQFKRDAIIKLLSTEVTNEEIAEGIEDDFGVVYSRDGSQLLKCNGFLPKSIQVKETCKVIRSNAFKFCSTMSNIILPNGLTHIGDSAFSWCENLSDITLPGNLVYIGNRVFEHTRIRDIESHSPNFTFKNGCLVDVRAKKLIAFLSDDENIELPTGFTYIVSDAFSYCVNLYSIILPDGLTHIGDRAFFGCKKLYKITLPKSLIFIGNCAFEFTKIREIISNSPCFTFNNGYLIEVKAKKVIAFFSDEKNTVLPAGLTHIGNRVFFHKQLFSISLPSSLKHIGDWAFPHCLFSNIILPASIVHIGERAFSMCPLLDNLCLPDNLLYIGDNAFDECPSLSNITLPATITHIGNCAFDNCVHLTRIYIPSGTRKHFKKLLPKELHSKLRIKHESLETDNKQTPIHYLFFDTETTGVPKNYNAPASNTSNWPRLVQLGWILTDDSGNEISSGNEIVKPEGFTIPSDASRVHGITTEIALREGKPLKQVIEAFLKDTVGIKCFVGHNVSFDQKVVGAELYRLGITDIVSTAKSLDTMKAATNYCKIPGTYGYKWPKLIELHRKLFGCDFEDAHDAMADITATKKCFFEMRRRNLI